MDSKKLTAIFKGLDTFTSTDKTRPHLMHVRAVSDTRLEATDGHRLAVVTVEGGHGLTVGSYDAGDVIKRLAAGVAPANGREFAWPDTQAVIDDAAREATEAVADAVHVNPLLLAEVAKGLAVACGVPKIAAPGVKMKFGADALSPVRFDLSHDGVTALALLMPVRA